MAFFKQRNLAQLSPTSDYIMDVLTVALQNEPAQMGLTALKNSDVFTAINILASDLATLPITTDNVHLNKLLNTKPNEIMNAFSFKYALMANMLLYGNSYAYINRKDGVPVELKFVPTVEIDNTLYDDHNIVYHWKTTDSKGKTSTYQINKEDMLHFKYATVNGLNGISPLYALTNEVALQNKGTNVLLSFFKRGALSSGILKVKEGQLDNESKANIRKAWDAANNGSENSSSTIILDGTMDYTPLELDTKVLDLVNSNTFSTKQIAKAFGIPLNRFGMELMSSSDGDLDLQYVKSTLRPYTTAFKVELENKLNAEILFNVGELLQTTFDKQASTMANLVEKGILTADEAKEKLFGKEL